MLCPAMRPGPARVRRARQPPDQVWGAPEYADAVLPRDRGGQPGRARSVIRSGGRWPSILAAAHPGPGSAAAGAYRRAPLCAALAGRSPAGAADRRATAVRALHRTEWVFIRDEKMERRRLEPVAPTTIATPSASCVPIFVKSIAEVDDGTYRAAFSATTCPIELVWGEDDTAARIAVAREASERNPSARLSVLPGVGHMTVTDAPEAVREAVERHL